MKGGNSKPIFWIAGIALFCITILVANVQKTQHYRLEYEHFKPYANIYTDTPQPIIISHPGGLYLEPFYLEIESEIEDAIIYFTLDGTVPVFGESLIFDQPLYIFDRTIEESLLSAIPGYRIGCFLVYVDDYFIPPEEPVFKATVIRVQAFDDQGIPLSEVYTNSYFVSEDIFERYSGLPIISLVTNADYFFCDEIGIYVRGHNNQGGHGPGDPRPNWHQRGREWERPAHMEWFEVDSDVQDWERAVAINLGVRIHGGGSRRLAQKALRLYARSYYDPLQSRIFHDVFQGNLVDRMGETIVDFSRLLLRNAGNEGSGSMFRDAGAQFLSRYMNADVQAYRPAVVFLNGEFWGLYNIRERFDEWYVSSHYNLSRYNIAIVEFTGRAGIELNTGQQEDLEDFRELLSFFAANSMEHDVNFQFAQRHIDMDSFIDAHIANIFFGDIDWPGNNARFWRYTGILDPDMLGRDGRWRWMLIDLDSTMGFSFAFNYYDDTLFRIMYLPPEERDPLSGDGMVTASSTGLFRGFMQNEEFRQVFANRFTDVMNTYFAEEPFLQMIESFSSNIRPVMPEQIARFGRINSMEDWEQDLEVMRTFARNRHGYMLEFLRENLDLGETITISTSADQSHGQVAINGILLPENWSGIYFEGMTQTFYAHPNEGYVFERFIIRIGENVIGHASTPMQLEINEDISVEARFTRERP